jgi:glycyl-tRNA synthetase alpha subunit
MMPTSPQTGNPQVDWDVAVERANATQCTYWITVKNLTANTVTFEGRYAVMP